MPRIAQIQAQGGYPAITPFHLVARKLPADGVGNKWAGNSVSPFGTFRKLPACQTYLFWSKIPKRQVENKKASNSVSPVGASSNGSRVEQSSQRSKSGEEPVAAKRKMRGGGEGRSRRSA